MADRERGRRCGDPPRLFAHGELRLRPSGQTALLRALARTPSRSPTARERKAEEDQGTVRKLKAMAQELAAPFGLRYAAIEAERDGIVAHYGICYGDGVIRIRLRHATTGRLLKESSLVDTLCHELAHLKHFDHSPRFKRFYLRILDEARHRGFYRPGPEDKPGARQGSLFEGWVCGTARSS